MSPAKKGGTTRATLGPQIHCDSPIMATSNEIETTSLVASLVPSNPRKITRSSRTPKRGASTSSTNTMATGDGQPHPIVICQYMNAASIPAAPWAKLKTPVVV